MPSLTELLKDPNPDIGCAVVTALSRIDDERIIGMLEDVKEKEEDQEVLDLIQEALNDLKTK
nr:HEAT repeat domain-containing protein [Paenibacillus ehimensis]